MFRKSFSICNFSILHKKFSFTSFFSSEAIKKKPLGDIVENLRLLGKNNLLHQDAIKLIDQFESLIEKQKEAAILLPKRDPKQVFTNTELSFDSIDVFGFDYDYTIASYTDKVQEYQYKESISYLIRELKYPPKLAEVCKYDPKFAIRGLYFDIKRGNILKLDSSGALQPDSIYCGRHTLPQSKAQSNYPGLYMARKYTEMLRVISDLYSIAEACLLADVIQYMIDHKLAFDPPSIYEDVIKAKDHVHSGRIHQEIMNSLSSYLNKDKAVGEFLIKLKESNKKTFLLTNSKYPFVDAGMKYLLSEISHKFSHWTELFDVVICNAHKPGWYTTKNEITKPFRKYDPKSQMMSWEKVKEFKKGEVYVHGSLAEFSSLTQWKGDRVIYFGDHLFNDLKEPVTSEGWKTGVIIRELETEVEIQNTPTYRSNLVELLQVEQLMNQIQRFEGEGHKKAFEILKAHRKDIRGELKVVFNKNFGSTFRTHKTATLFAHHLQRFANVYTSRIDNFLQYPMHFLFYPDRQFLPHETKVPSFSYGAHS